MTPTHDTAPLAAAESPLAAARRVFLLGPGAPLAECAAALMSTWGRDPDAPPALVLVAEEHHAALVEALRPRLLAAAARKLEPEQCACMREAVRAALDGGATLVAGGHADSQGLWQPTLFLHPPTDSSLLGARPLPAPLLAVYRTRADRPARRILDLIDDACPPHLHHLP